MKHTESIAPETEAEVSVDEPVKGALQIGVKVTGAVTALDRFIVCMSYDDAQRLLNDLNESRSRFVRYGDLLIAVEFAAYVEVVEQ